MGRKNIVLKFRAINREIFEAVKTGKKKVETRAATDKYRAIKAGDTVVLVCGKNKFEKEVKKVKIFKTITSLLKVYKPQQINPGIKTLKETREMYYSFPGYKEKIKKYGLAAFELK